MSDIFDYMKWRGDLDIHQDGFNEVDNLILSVFSYVPLDTIVSENYKDSITIGEAALEFSKNKSLWKRLRMRNDKRLFEEIGKCSRFSKLVLRSYVNIINSHEEKQFSAVSIELGDGSLFVSYRGTDNTLIGWKEDFNMSFMRQVPAQANAIDYLENIATCFSGPLRVGGHSKGGNLAVYASAFCSQTVQNRIIAIYNNDGPWLHTDKTYLPGYAAIRQKINAFIPQTSIIGMLLEREENYIVVRSTQTGPFQHDFYSWEVMGANFVCLDTITNSSKFIDQTLKSWLQEWDEEQRAIFVDVLFQIISATGASTFQEMIAKWPTSTMAMLRSFIALDDDMRKVIYRTIKLLTKAARKNLKDITPSSLTNESNNKS